MENNSKVSKLSDDQKLLKDYEDLVNSTNSSSVVVNTEWRKNGDYFEKFSMYDSLYTPVKTLGDTTLINYNNAKLERSNS